MVISKSVCAFYLNWVSISAIETLLPIVKDLKVTCTGTFFKINRAEKKWRVYLKLFIFMLCFKELFRKNKFLIQLIVKINYTLILSCFFSLKKCTTFLLKINNNNFINQPYTKIIVKLKIMIKKINNILTIIIFNIIARQSLFRLKLK